MTLSELEKIFFFGTSPCDEKIVFIPQGSKTVIDTNFEKGIRFFRRNDWGMVSNTNVIIPHIKDIEVIKNRVVVITFEDDSKEKAVLNNIDTFSLEQGISICITKKMLSMQTDNNGSSAYNKLIKYCLKLYKNKQIAEEKAKVDKQTIKEKDKKIADRAKAKRIKQANENREREIEIQKEAYLRAMREFDGNPAINKKHREC